jgi:uncharacterized protein YjbI with pentapeptide repeats
MKTIIQVIIIFSITFAMAVITIQANEIEDLECLKERRTWHNCILKGKNLEKMRLIGIGLSGADLTGTNLIRSNLKRAILKMADLSFSELQASNF